MVIYAVYSWPLTRDAYREVARGAGQPFVDIEVVCADEAEHKPRLMQRLIDIDGLEGVAWPVDLSSRACGR